MNEISIPMPHLPAEQSKAVMLQLLARSHVGAARGISAAALAGQAHTSERMLRKLISEARDQGIAICGTPTTGYYIAETAEELQQCCAFLRSRAMHSLRIEAQLRRVPLADLLGQLHLPT